MAVKTRVETTFSAMPVNGRVDVENRPDLVQSDRNDLFTSGTLGVGPAGASHVAVMMVFRVGCVSAFVLSRHTAERAHAIALWAKARARAVAAERLLARYLAADYLFHARRRSASLIEPMARASDVAYELIAGSAVNILAEVGSGTWTLAQR